MPTHPYIHFQGQCAQALAFYADVFGGTGLQIMRYAEGPGATPTWTSSDRVMHGQLAIGDGTLMASDFPPGTEGDPQKGFSVMQTAPDVARGKAIFDRLTEGGTIIDAFKPTIFSPGFGMVQDKFGTHWIISTIPAA